MKKITTRILAAISALISLFFVVFLLMTVFGKVAPKEFDNSVVKTLCLALGGVFFASTVVGMVFLYSDNDAVKEILLHYEKGGTAKSSVSVARKITKENVRSVEGVTYRRSKAFAGEYGVRLKVWISVKDRDIKDAEELLRAILEDAFLGTLGFKFYAIDFHVKKIEAKYKVDIEKIKERKNQEAARKRQKENASELEEAEAGLETTIGEDVERESFADVKEKSAEKNGYRRDVGNVFSVKQAETIGTKKQEITPENY